MKKAIVKCKLSSKHHFEQKLKDIELDFSPVYWQHDRIYVPRGYNPKQNYPRLVMRTTIHDVDKTPVYSLILRRHIEDSGVDVVEETPVTDYATTVNIILQLGFKPISEISRRRKELNMGEGTMIYLDSIDNHPDTYAKIETPLVEGDSTIEVKNDLKKTFATLGETDIIESPYFELH